MTDAAVVPSKLRPAAAVSTSTRPTPIDRRREIVRPLEARDLDGVAELFLSRFRSARLARDERARAEVAEYMRQLFLDGPNAGPAAASLVQTTAGGAVGAFVGAFSQTF